MRRTVHRLLTGVFPPLFSLFVRLTCGLNRFSVTGLDIFERYAEQGGNVFALWHSRLLYVAYRYLRSGTRRKVSVLVSMSRDGDYGEALGRRFGQDVVRGSTNRGGQRAIRRLAARAAEGNNLVITPDGPRGPAFRVNDGVIRLAQITGSRIIPVSYDASRKFTLKSWDRFILVAPFGHVHVAVGEPIAVPKDLDPQQLEAYRLRLEQSLLELDRICAERTARGRAKAAAREEPRYSARAEGSLEQVGRRTVPPGLAASGTVPAKGQVRQDVT